MGEGPSQSEVDDDLKASRASLEVTALLPYRKSMPSSVQFGKYFNYIWPMPNPDGTLLAPALRYTGGGLTGVTRWERTGTSAYFHGTDGQYLYVTIGGSACDEKHRYRIDKLGAVTNLARIPRGLRGGMDQRTGGPACPDQ